MRRAPQQRLEAAARAEATPFAGGGLIGEDLGHVQVIAADAEIFLGIGHGRSQQLADRCGSPLGEFQPVYR